MFDIFEVVNISSSSTVRMQGVAPFGDTCRRTTIQLALQGFVNWSLQVQGAEIFESNSHTIHGTGIYLPTWMVDFYGKCREIYHWYGWYGISWSVFTPMCFTMFHPTVDSTCFFLGLEPPGFHSFYLPGCFGCLLFQGWYRNPCTTTRMWKIMW